VEGKRMTPRAADGTELVMPQLIVPAYFHPAIHPGEWAWLAERAAQIRLVVLNLADGPGSSPDAAVFPVMDRLQSAGVSVAGYVDTNYGQRPVNEALADLARYQDWYKVAGVFFDRAAAAAEHLGYYASLALRARQLGAQVVALNHGTHPIEDYADHADLLGTFEGPWRAYLDLAVPRWARSRPAGQFYHLPHSVPPESFGDAFWLAARRNAGGAYVTDQGGPNPWGRLPAGQFYPPEP
jgi:Spherulation-specific family 4